MRSTIRARGRTTCKLFRTTFADRYELVRELDRDGMAALANRYTLDRELGRGGMATCSARDVRHARQVAIKVLHAALAAVLGARRFVAEIKTTANLQHSHLLPLFDSGNADSQVFYVRPFVAGETLRGRLERETQLPIDAAVRIAQAVQHAGGQRMTQTGVSLGTPQYMAPEQALGNNALDSRPDIYALGAVTYEMLAGEPPFTGPTAQAIIARVLTSDAPALQNQRKTVPLYMADAVHHALEELPADRVATAVQFTVALANADSSGERTRSHEKTLVQLWRRPKRQGRPVDPSFAWAYAGLGLTCTTIDLYVSPSLD